MVELMETHRKGPNKCHPNLISQNNEVTITEKGKCLLKKETHTNLRPSGFAAGKKIHPSTSFFGERGVTYYYTE